MRATTSLALLALAAGASARYTSPSPFLSSPPYADTPAAVTHPFGDCWVNPTTTTTVGGAAATTTLSLPLTTTTSTTKYFYPTAAAVEPVKRDHVTTIYSDPCSDTSVLRIHSSTILTCYTA
jgi:hypothetical protein